MAVPMGSFTHSQLKHYSRALLLVHATRTPEDLASHLLKALRTIVAGDIAVVDWGGQIRMPVRTVYDPGDAIPGEINEAVHRHLADNPMYGRRHLVATSISDHLSVARWHRTALYAEAYDCVGQEDGLAIDIELGGKDFVSLNVTRGRRGYTDGERMALGLLGPHVREVYHRLQRQQRLLRQVVALPADTSPKPLSAREREVLLWVAEGRTNAQIADLLGIRPGTVKRHLENLYAKLAVANRMEAAIHCREQGYR